MVWTVSGSAAVRWICSQLGKATIKQKHRQLVYVSQYLLQARIQQRPDCQRVDAEMRHCENRRRVRRLRHNRVP